MGRYYSGDIEGKFWFAVQSSGDASFFGVEPSEPNSLQYDFSKDDLPKVVIGIKQCEEALFPYLEKLTAFFSKGGKGWSGYNDEMIEKELEIDNEKTKELLKWFARLELGRKIEKCLKKQEYCSFEAEL